MTAAVAVEALEVTLRQLAPTLERLCRLLVEERQALAEGDLQRILALTVEQEDTTARSADLERRRQKLQSELEAASPCAAWPAWSTWPLATTTNGPTSQGLVVELRRQVVSLHTGERTQRRAADHGHRVAHRTSRQPARLSGTNWLTP